MTVRNLEFLFRPASVAVVAEPDEPSRYAEVVLANLAAGGFSGPIMSVSARKRACCSSWVTRSASANSTWCPIWRSFALHWTRCLRSSLNSARAARVR
jgi:hypothetical protein